MTTTRYMAATITRRRERWVDFSAVELHQMAHDDPQRFVRLLDEQRAARHAGLPRHPQFAQRV